MDRVSIKAYVIDYIKSMHYLFLQVCTAGSKNHDPERTGAAFYVPECEVRKSGRITDGTSVYTAEMIAILMALGCVYEVRTDKVIIPSDSMAALMSLQSHQTHRSDS